MPTDAAAHRAWTEPLPGVFVNGDFVDVADARVSAHAHALSYGTGTFEGIRGSWNAEDREVYLLEPAAHYARMAQSAAVLGLELPYATDKLVAITSELIRRNRVESDVYVRPLLLLGGDELAVRMHSIETRFSIALSRILRTYIDVEAGARCMVSTWRRAPDVSVPSRAKLTGSYVGPALAKTEATKAGFDEAIMLNVDGHVAEGTTSNLFMRRGARWFTPPPQDDILEGITRAQAMTLIEEELGSAVVERSIDRSELYIADEIFLTGTAAQIVAVASIDGRDVGSGAAGDMTIRLAQLLDQVSRRRIDRHREWTVPVLAEVVAA